MVFYACIIFNMEKKRSHYEKYEYARCELIEFKLILPDKLSLIYNFSLLAAIVNCLRL